MYDFHCVIVSLCLSCTILCLKNVPSLTIVEFKYFICVCYMRFVHILTLSFHSVCCLFHILPICQYTVFYPGTFWGGNSPPQLRILRPRTWGEVYYYVNVIPESLGLVLKINKVTVIIYSLTCCEASFLAAIELKDSFLSTPFCTRISLFQ